MLGKPSDLLTLRCRLVLFVSWCFYLKSQPTFPPQHPKMAPHLRDSTMGPARSVCGAFTLPESSAAAFQVLGGTQEAPRTHTYTRPPHAAGRWGRWLGRLGPLVGAVGGARAAGSRCPPIGVRVATATAPAAPAGPQRERVMSRARRRPVWAARG